jgi:hypothetical protein
MYQPESFHENVGSALFSTFSLFFFIARTHNHEKWETIVKVFFFLSAHMFLTMVTLVALYLVMSAKICRLLLVSPSSRIESPKK